MTTITQQELTYQRKAGKHDRIREMLKTLIAQPQPTDWLENHDGKSAHSRGSCSVVANQQTSGVRVEQTAHPVR